MADAQYKTFNLVLESRGISARYVDDATPNAVFLNEDNCEELDENAIGSRLGTQIINKTGSVVNALPGLVHSVNELNGLAGAAWRYAGVGTGLYRRNAAGTGPYTLLSNLFSGKPWQAASGAPSVISTLPTMFFADANGMFKDNGTLASPQQMGIFQPAFPVQAQAQEPDLIALDPFTDPAGSYSYTGIGGGTSGTYVSTTLASAVVATGIQTVSVADPTQPGLFQLLTIGSGPSQETVLAIFLTPTGFTANFTKLHSIGDTVTTPDLTVTVPASTTATVSKSFSGTPIAAWPTTLQQADYIGLYLYVSDPTQVQSITLKFDCGDGSFDTDFFYKVIAQGPLQSLLATINDPTTAATDALLSESLGLYGNSSGSIAQLNSGLAQWTPLLIQLSDFAGSGRADFSDPVHNWNAVNGYQIEIVTNDNTSADVGMSSLILFGGAGPDSFGGVSYDYLFTFYNTVDGTESNPCMTMSDIFPPLQTNFVVPRRQPVLLTMNTSIVDSQTNRLRVYRRGGTLGDNYRRVDEIPLGGDGVTTYLDIASDSDIEDNDFISFVNDVPVTSSLPTPVNTTLLTAITTTNQVVSVFPASMANISVRQQVSLGMFTLDDLLQNFETVIVLAIFSDHFTAFVQNTHAVGELITATASYGQPVTLMVAAYDQFYFAGDTNNPNYLYYSGKSTPQAVSSAAYVEVAEAGDTITIVAEYKGNLYVSCLKSGWWSIAPGSNGTGKPTVYPTACKHGGIAPNGWFATEEALFYQAIDGLRAFAGGASQYLSQDQEFIFQGIGTTPIVEADQTQLNKTRAAFWNNMHFWSYVGVDGNRHRLIYHQIYKRWRNDDLDAESIFLEKDTNTLVFGDSEGLVHIDRIGTIDEGNNAGTLVQLPIDMDLQTPFLNQGMPVQQKQYQEFTLDCNTNGQTIAVMLIFNDGEFSESLGTITTTSRQRINLNLNNGDGFMAYKVSLQLTCAATQRVYIYQAAIRALALAMTRQSMDTFNLKFSTDESKLVKQSYWEYTSTTPINVTVQYDDPCWPPYSFTLPSSNGARVVIRIRFPAVKLRWMRTIATSTADFMLWSDSNFEVKPICSGKGYGKFEMTSLEG